MISLKRSSRGDLVLSADVGTTATKSVIFDTGGHVMASSSIEHGILHSQPEWAETNPNDWWNAFLKTAKNCIKKSRSIRSNIVGISVTSQREAAAPVDHNGETAANAILWIDRRTDSQVAAIRKKISPEEILEITGLQLSYVFTASKLIWMKENCTKLFQTATQFLPPKDYVNFRLTGESATDPSMASRTMLFDINKRQWSEKICDTLQIPITKLPTIRRTSEIIGETSTEAQKLLGLKRKIPVLVSGADNQFEGMSGGAIGEGEIAIGTGTGDTIEVALNAPRPDKTGRADCCCHVVEEKWVYELVLSGTGESTNWFKNTFGQEEINKSLKSSRNAYAYLFDLAKTIVPGANGLCCYPCLSGALAPNFDPKARGIFFGITHGHRKGHFVRAILEGIAFQYFGAIQILRELGLDPKEISHVSGATRNTLLNQIKADVLNRKIVVPLLEDAPAFAASAMFAYSQGYYKNIREAVQKMTRRRKTYTPRKTIHERYMQLYQRYEKIYKIINPAFSEL